MSDTAPWKLAHKRDLPETRIIRNWIIFNCAEALRIAGILLQPIMPSKAKHLLDEMKVHPDRRTIDWAKYGADTDYGLTRNDLDALGRVQAWETIFPPVPSGELTDEQVKEEFAEILAKPGRHRLRMVADYIALEARMGHKNVSELLEAHRPKGKQLSSVQPR